MNESRYKAFLEARESAGLTRVLAPTARGESREIRVGGRGYLNFSDNDYLGLATDPRLARRAAEWAGRLGAGSAASRLVTGNLDVFAGLEEKTARFKGTEAALIMASGFQANAAVLEALLDRSVLGAGPLVFADRLNHASMHFGCKAAGVRQLRYRHCDAGHLAGLLEQHADSDAPKFILTESVFSMDGDIAPLEDIAALARAHKALLVVDDAHGTGILGAGGKGLGAGADIIIGTFSKAMGSFGAYVACSAVLRDYLVNRCTGLIYSTALPPAVLGAIDAALDLVPGMDEERARTANHAQRFRDEAAALGYDSGGSRSQIVPLMVGEPEAALALAGRLREAGIWAVAIRPPTVPQGTARIRFAFSAAHSEDDVSRLVEAVAAGGKRRRAIA